MSANDKSRTRDATGRFVKKAEALVQEVVEAAEEMFQVVSKDGPVIAKDLEIAGEVATMVSPKTGLVLETASKTVAAVSADINSAK